MNSKTFLNGTSMVYINLDKRQDRRDALMQDMQEFGMESSRLVRFSGIDHAQGILGCTTSHCQVLDEHLRRYEKATDLDQDVQRAECDSETNHNNNTARTLPALLVFEDDFQWTQDKEHVEGILEQFFSEYPTEEWDVLMFAASVFDLKTSPSKVSGIHKVHSAQTATAYLINPRYIPTLLKTFKESLELLSKAENPELVGYLYALDIRWKMLQAKDNWFISCPGFGVQRPGFSNIERKFNAYAYI